MRRNADLAAVATLAAGSVLIVLGVRGLPILRLPFAILLLLVLPGYSLLAALFPAGAIRGSRRVLLSGGLSISVDVLIGLGLNLSPFHLRAGSWALALLAFVFVGCAVATGKRMRGGPARETSIRGGLSLRPTYLDALFLLAAAALLVLAVALGRRPLPTKNAIGYTTLWLLPARAKEPSAFRFGLESRQLHPVTYRVVLRRGNHVFYAHQLPVLQPGQQYHDSVRVTAAVARGRVPIEAFLYNVKRPRSVYRFAKLWPRNEH